MKKTILVILVIILPLTCLAGSIQQMHKAVIARQTVAAGGCESGTSRAACVDATPTQLNLYSTGAGYAYLGQKFQVSAAGDLYSITLILTNEGGGDDTVEIRFDTDTNFTDATYTESFTVSNAASTEYEIVFDPAPTLSTLTDYYFAIYSDSADWSDRNLVDSSSDSNCDGVNDALQGNVETSWGSGAWSSVVGKDLVFTVKVCD
jgi:hypothetical protein